MGWAEVSSLDCLAGTLSRGECRSMDRKLCECPRYPEQLSHLGVTFFLVPTSPEHSMHCATSRAWPQERGLCKVCAALGYLGCQMSAKRCSWKIHVSNPSVASDFSTVGLSLGLQQTQKMQNKTTASLVEFQCQPVSIWIPVCPSKATNSIHHPLTVTTPLFMPWNFWHFAFPKYGIFLATSQPCSIFANNSSHESWHLSPPPGLLPVIVLELAPWITGAVQHPWARAPKSVHYLLNALP